MTWLLLLDSLVRWLVVLSERARERVETQIFHRVFCREENQNRRG
jgi:hypothetical protein